MNLEPALLRRVGEAIGRFRMIREGDRVAVALSGGKDSLALLEALLRLQQRAPVRFSLCAFTIEQGKFQRSLAPLEEWLRRRGVEWLCLADPPSLRLIETHPDHGCDLCSRYRRRAVYQAARALRANVIAFGHTADDLCEAFLRNALFTGRISALPPVTWSSRREFRLIRPLLYVSEHMTRQFVERLGAPVTPCACSLRTGGVREQIRGLLAELEKRYPHLMRKLVAAMGHVDAGRLLDPRFLELEGDAARGTSRALATVSTDS
ncbi:MAG: ATP-binding protein [Bryobacteraceae bacterium]